MPVTTLTSKTLKSLACPAGRDKENFHDASCKGLMLEVRAKGGRTWYLRYRDARGKQRQFRIGDVADVDLALARKRADELRGQIALGQDPVDEKAVLRQVPTFESFALTQYLPFVQGYKRAWKTDESLLRNHLLPALGSCYLDQISKNAIVALHHGHRNAGAAPSSANHLLVLLRYMFNLALKWEVPGVTKNPASGIPLFEKNNHKERYLTHAEAQRLYQAVQESDNSMLQFIIPGLILTGARKRELLDAQWADFDLGRRLWRIPLPKSGKARHVPLSDGMLQLLARVQVEQAQWPAAMRPCPWPFANPDTGKPYVSFFCSWDTARKKAGLAEVRIHDLRHSFASFLINQGRSLYEIKTILGHSQLKTTERYSHLSQDTLLEAANVAVQALGTAFSPALPAAPTNTAAP